MYRLDCMDDESLTQHVKNIPINAEYLIHLKGDDSVMACKLNGGSASFELGFNTGKSYSSIPDVSKFKKKMKSSYLNKEILNEHFQLWD